MLASERATCTARATRDRRSLHSPDARARAAKAALARARYDECCCAYVERARRIVVRADVPLEEQEQATGEPPIGSAQGRGSVPAQAGLTVSLSAYATTDVAFTRTAHGGSRISTLSPSNGSHGKLQRQGPRAEAARRAACHVRAANSGARGCQAACRLPNYDCTRGFSPGPKPGAASFTVVLDGS